MSTSSEIRYTNGPENDDLNHSGSEEDEQGGDYSTRMEELFADDSPELKEEGLNFNEEEDEEEEGFLYTGDDADLSTGYRDQLRDVLEDDSEADIHEELQSDDEHDPLVCNWAHNWNTTQYLAGNLVWPNSFNANHYASKNIFSFPRRYAFEID